MSKYDAVYVDLTKHQMHKIRRMMNGDENQITLLIKSDPNGKYLLPINKDEAAIMARKRSSKTSVNLTPSHILDAAELHSKLPEDIQQRGGFLPLLAGLGSAIVSNLPTIAGVLGALGGLGGIIGGAVSAAKNSQAADEAAKAAKASQAVSNEQLRQLQGGSGVVEPCTMDPKSFGFIASSRSRGGAGLKRAKGVWNI